MGTSKAREDGLSLQAGAAGTSTGDDARQSTRDWAARCDADGLSQTLREAWARGERIGVEELLRRGGHAAVGDGVLVDLLYGEYVLREGAGEAPDAAEFIRRFPAAAVGLRRQLCVHRELSARLGMIASDQPAAGAADAPGREVAMPAAIGKYRVVTRLGSGGQAEVYRAFHPDLGRDVVIKIAREPAAQGPLQRERLLNEGRILARLTHPHLVRVLDLDFLGARPYLVMEYTEGIDLEQYARRQAVLPREAAAIVARIARAVAVAHRLGVTHRDIKPRNVLIAQSGSPQLIDFGLSSWRDAWAPAAESPGELAGTLAYMAPEQARAESAGEDPRSDVFGLGATLYFLLTGRPPFAATTAAATLALAQAGHWDREALEHSPAPPRLRDTCARALSSTPSDRQATADRLADELVACRGRHARGWHVAAAALLVALVGVGLWAMGDHTSRSNGPSADAERRGAADTKAAAPGQAEWEIGVWRDEQCFALRDVAPLHDEDAIQLGLHAPADLQVSLFVLNGAGQWRHLHDWLAPAANGELRFPDRQQQAAPLRGPPGTELLLACGRRSAHFGLEELEGLWDQATPWPALSELTLVTMQVDRVRLASLARDFGPAQDIDAPDARILRRLEDFRRRLAPRVDWLSGVGFRHQ